VALAAVYFLAGGMFRAAPGGFLPDEDQGVVFVQMRLPDGASLERNEKVRIDIENYLLSIPGVEDVVTFGGLDMTTQTSSSNVSTLIAVLKPWEERRTPETQLGPIIGQINAQLSQTPEAFIIAFGLPPILGLGTAGGFEFMVEDRTGGDPNQLALVAEKLAAEGPKTEPSLGFVANTFRVSVPGYRGICIYAHWLISCKMIFPPQYLSLRGREKGLLPRPCSRILQRMGSKTL
jgi:multidrug efflux pump subunit AcrB